MIEATQEVKQAQIKKRKKRLDRMGANMLKEQVEKGKAIGIDEIEAVVKKVDETEKEQKEAGVDKFRVDRAVWADDEHIILNKDPDKHYVFARKDELRELAIAAKKGYTEAVGNEIIFGMTHPTPGKPKILNDSRILLCCPQAKVDARNQAMLRRLDAQHRQGNKNKADELQSQVGEKIGVSVFSGTEK